MGAQGVQEHNWGAYYGPGGGGGYAVPGPSSVWVEGWEGVLSLGRGILGVVTTAGLCLLVGDGDGEGRGHRREGVGGHCSLNTGKEELCLLVGVWNSAEVGRGGGGGDRIGPAWYAWLNWLAHLLNRKRANEKRVYPRLNIFQQQVRVHHFVTRSKHSK